MKFSKNEKVLILSPIYLIGGITLTWWLAPQLAMDGVYADIYNSQFALASA